MTSAVILCKHEQAYYHHPSADESCPGGTRIELIEEYAWLEGSTFYEDPPDHTEPPPTHRRYVTGWQPID